MDIWTFWPVSLTLIEVDRVQTAKEGVCVCVCVCCQEVRNLASKP